MAFELQPISSGFSHYCTTLLPEKKSIDEYEEKISSVVDTLCRDEYIKRTLHTLVPTHLHETKMTTYSTFYDKVFFRKKLFPRYDTNSLENEINLLSGNTILRHQKLINSWLKRLEALSFLYVLEQDPQFLKDEYLIRFEYWKQSLLRENRSIDLTQAPTREELATLAESFNVYATVYEDMKRFIDEEDLYGYKPTTELAKDIFSSFEFLVEKKDSSPLSDEAISSIVSKRFSKMHIEPTRRDNHYYEQLLIKHINDNENLQSCFEIFGLAKASYTCKDAIKLRKLSQSIIDKLPPEAQEGPNPLESSHFIRLLAASPDRFSSFIVKTLDLFYACQKLLIYKTLGERSSHTLLDSIQLFSSWDKNSTSKKPLKDKTICSLLESLKPEDFLIENVDHPLDFFHEIKNTFSKAMKSFLPDILTPFLDPKEDARYTRFLFDLLQTRPAFIQVWMTLFYSKYLYDVPIKIRHNVFKTFADII